MVFCKIRTRRWWSGLSQETVNLPPSGFVGSNPTRRTREEKVSERKLFLFCGEKPAAYLNRYSCAVREGFLVINSELRLEESKKESLAINFIFEHFLATSPFFC